HEFRIDCDLLFQRHRPWLRVRLGIVDRDFDLEVSEIGPADSLSDFGVRCEDASIPVDPQVVAKTDRVDDERIALPSRARAARPPGGGLACPSAAPGRMCSSPD